jgi:hypothetical protein
MQSAAKFKRIKLTAKDVMKPMIALLFVNIIVLVVWTVIDPLHVETTNIGFDEFDRTIESRSTCRSEHEKIFYSILGLVNMGSLAFSVIQAYQARKISTEFNESNYIFVAMVSHVHVFLISEYSQSYSEILSFELAVDDSLHSLTWHPSPCNCQPKRCCSLLCGGWSFVCYLQLDSAPHVRP